ncbi:AraC family transcriptional regulator [Streptomonospora sp. S1-112]|uniref:AraC family transcriptional regulator n=1 Tax=Streptomonospora mangrovi TaxID=2883123 RepID=A0A9X3NMT4_9ACTN|nr:AraC family transcriptional regulator [Streptomonospora mangrovi]MDA0563390.1 AraC family transcriptional regulator [Streptomonospora mangrovi]
MDPLAGLLDGPRARGAFLLRVAVDPPWSIRVADRAPLSLVAVVHGRAHLRAAGTAPQDLGPGDVALLRGPHPYTFADSPDTPVRVVIGPQGPHTSAQHCAAADGGPLAETTWLGTRTWGTNPQGAARLLVGTYNLGTEVGRRILTALPPAVVLGAGAWRSPLVGVLDEEIDRDEPGQEVVLDRLLDLLLISAVRAWFSRPAPEAPAWYRAQGDPVVGPALRLLHEEPARPWTVADLAARTGVSRATLARRFAEVVGEPPMAYLTGWRLALAADLLREPEVTVTAVARRVGYATPFALSAAFKRRYGVSPQQHRRAHAPEPDTAPDVEAAPQPVP